jgi:hypothetical protein
MLVNKSTEQVAVGWVDVGTIGTKSGECILQFFREAGYFRIKLFIGAFFSLVKFIFLTST